MKSLLTVSKAGFEQLSSTLSWETQNLTILQLFHLDKSNESWGKAKVLINTLKGVEFKMFKMSDKKSLVE